MIPAFPLEPLVGLAVALVGLLPMRKGVPLK